MDGFTKSSSLNADATIFIPQVIKSRNEVPSGEEAFQSKTENKPKIIETKQESIFSKENKKEQWKLPDSCGFDEIDQNYLFAANACCFTFTLLVLFS